MERNNERGFLLMTTLTVTITLTEELLGTASADKELHSEYIASKAPDAMSREEEIAALGAEEVERKQMTIFPRDEYDRPFMWDYQVKGFLKEACKHLRKVEGTACSKVKAYKSDIDGLIFVYPRAIPIMFYGEVGNCQRPLRASTPLGERIALSNAESVPAGAVLNFEIEIMEDKLVQMVKECLCYGKKKGLGQWRNSGKGRFIATIDREDKGELIL